MSDDIKQEPVAQELTELELAQQQAAEYLAGWQRAKADYDNLQKDTARQRQEYVQFATSQLIMELLPVYDHFKMAMNQVPADAAKQPWMQGLSHIKKQLLDVLQQQGVEEIKTVGEKFNPAVHEAVDHIVDAEQDDDLVVKETRGGYVLGGKVIQAAKVVVVKNS